MLSFTPALRPTLRSKALLVGLAVFLVTTLRPVLAADNVVLQWNQEILTAIRNTKAPPPIASRALAITHTAMFDAWAAYDSVARSTRLGGMLRRPEGERTAANKEKAISFAAYRVLVDLFPSETSAFDARMSSLSYNPSDRSADASTSSGIGNICAQALPNYRHSDGSNQLGDLHPGAYSDYTGYTAINTAEKLNDPNKWQPLLVRSPEVALTAVGTGNAVCADLWLAVS